MSKTLFCAAVALLGGMVGANAPADWRSDAPRYTRAAGLAEPPTIDAALVFRPYQRGN